MRHSTILSMLASATLLAGHPAVAQDTQGAAPAEGPTINMEELFESLKIPPDRKEDLDTSQPVVGFGFQIVDDGVKIARVLEGSAAQAAGLRVGMIIERINGARLSTFTLEEIAKLIAAIDGEITFVIRETGDVTLRKAPIEQQGS